MRTEKPKHNPLNRQLAREIVLYAEICAARLHSREDLDLMHSRWDSRYFHEYEGPSPSIVASMSIPNRLSTDTAILSLSDQEEVVGLRIVLAIAGFSIHELRRGLADEQMPAFTTGVCQLANSPLQIRSVSYEDWQSQANSIVDLQRPGLLVVEGLGLGRNTSAAVNFSDVSDVMTFAGANGVGLLLFD